MRRFYAPVANFANKTVSLDADETRHLRDVLRLRAQDEVSVFDGGGGEFRCKISTIGKKSAELAIIEETEPASPESTFEITLAAAILNGERFDFIIQKAAELGVAVIVPVTTSRCDVRLKDAERRMKRWRRIALDATKQSGRAKLMQIAEPSSFDKFIANSEVDNMVLFSERDGGSFSSLKKSKKITALFGPKGGWDDFELEAARSSGIKIVTLGGRILRAETAAISITAILQHRFGDLN